MSLGDWRKNGWLADHEASPEETCALLRMVERDLKDCRSPGLSTDWRLNIAYHTALQAATVALHAAGYRAARDAHHYRIIQSLAHTVGAGAGRILLLDQFRKKRSRNVYETSGIVLEKEAVEMVRFAEGLRDDVEHWLKSVHPELLKQEEGK